MIVYNNIESGMTEVYLGNQSIAQVYIGANKVFPNSTPPTPYHFKAQYTNVDSTTGEVACNSSSILTYTDFPNTLNLLHITVGECVDGFDTHLVDVNYRSLRTIDLTHSNITTVPKNFMEGVSTLRNAYLNESTTTISQGAFSACASLSAITIPSSVTSIGLNAFRESGLREITYYSGITYGAYVYYSCSSASALTIEQGTTRIEQGTFASCSGLTSLTIPSSVAYIGTQAFSLCTGLSSITVNATTPPILGDSVFAMTNDCPILVPCQSLSLYLQEWAEYASRLQCIPTPSYQWVSYASGDTVPTATTVYGVRIYPLYDSNYNVTFSGSNGDYIRLYPDGFSDWVAVDENGTPIDISSYRIRPGYTEYEIPFSDLGMGGMNIISPTTIFKDDIDLYIPNS